MASIILATPRPNGTVLSIATSLVRPARRPQRAGRAMASPFYLERVVGDGASSVCDEVDRAVFAARAASSASSAWGEAGVVETTAIAWASPVMLLSFAAVEVARPWPA